MHGFLEADMGDKPALQPQAAIGPAVRAIAGNILAGARAVITDPERSNQDAVHDFRRAMKQWRALMRLLDPFIPDAVRWQREARDLARSLAQARDGQSALNALDDLVKKGNLALSPRSIAVVRGRIEAIRASEEQAVLTPELRDTIIAWLDAAAAATEHWPLDPFDFSAIAEQLASGYRRARSCIPADWSQASPEDLHGFRQRVVDHRYQMELVEPLWPRLMRVWVAEAQRLRDRLGSHQDLVLLAHLTEPHQPLAPWRSRLVPLIAARQSAHTATAQRLVGRLFAEKPRAFQRRLAALWKHRAET